MPNPARPGTAAPDDRLRRVRLAVRGVVQGVGFRPFVYRIARELELAGWVRNGADGVTIEIEGSAAAIDRFSERLRREHPPLAQIDRVEATEASPEGAREFRIAASHAGAAATLVLPDVATCPLCVADVFAPGNRRYRYPFTNCTNCGPRYTIIESLPYDRPSTTMRGFAMCSRCVEEYGDPGDRRFHAQPNACPECGPQLALWDGAGVALAARDEALREAAEVVRLGGIVALKGLGGFHLVADARNDATVARLREAKHREEKPFALMVPTRRAVEAHCRVSNLEARILASPRAPIVLLRRAGRNASLSPLIAPGNPYLGVMLPYTPLHHLLMEELGFPIVATSGNRADEPICTDEREALERLEGIADFFLVHDRPIARHVDDSVVAVVDGTELVLRRSRGFAPLPVATLDPAAPLVAVGAHQKNTIAITSNGRIFLSQHIGDLDTPEAIDAFRATTLSLRTLFDQVPAVAAHDLHPAYASTLESEKLSIPRVGVQHHHAHVAACMAEHGLRGPVLGIAWDGSGWGPDGTVWGGEFLVADRVAYERFASLLTFPLPGGEQAVREPRRCALGVLWEMEGSAALDRPQIAAAFTPQERKSLGALLANERLAPRTSSVGRLFDAVAFLAGLRARCSFEGQAAMELEWSMDPDGDESGGAAYPIEIADGAPLRVDWRAMIRWVLDDASGGTPAAVIASRFHHALARAALEVARRARLRQVALTGGCFQNRVLLRRTAGLLRSEGFEVFTHAAIPPNDGGIAVGQIAVAAATVERWTEDLHAVHR